MKKFLTYSVVIATIAWSMGISAVLPAAAAYTPTDGDLIKTATYPAVYYVSGGKKYLFVNRATFGTWRADFSGLKVVSQADFDSVNLGGNVTARPGVNLVKFDNSDNVYAVTPGAVLVKVEAAAKTALYGSAAPIVIQSSFEANYTKSADVLTATSKYPNGTLIKSGTATYLVLDGKLSMLTGDAYTANGLKSAYEHTVADISGYTAGSAITGAVSSVSSIVSGAGAATNPATAGGVTVSLASDSPASANLASGTAFNSVLKVNLTAGSQAAAVTGLKLKKSGFIGNTSITSIAVYDASGVRHGNAASSINSDNEVNLIFTSEPINIPAGQTVTATIKVNIAAAAGASTFQLGLAAADSVTAGGSVTGSFPVTGNLMNTVSSNNSIASSTVGIRAVNASGLSFGIDATSQQDITKFNLAEIGGQEAMVVKSLTLYNNGNATAADYSDVSLVASDGTVLATAQPVGQYVTFSGLNYRIDKGTNKDLTVRAKILGGTTRTIQLVIYNDYDVMIQGQSSGAYVVPIRESASDDFPIDGGAGVYNKATIGSGTITFGKDSSSPNVAVAPGTSSVVLAKFYVKPSGEDMELRTISLGIFKSGGTALTGSVYVKVNDSSVWSDSASNVNATASMASSTLQSYYTLKSGVNSYITVIGSVSSNATSTDAYKVYLDVNNVKRLATNDIIDAGTSVDSGNTISVQAASLKVTTLSTPVAQTTVNSNDFEFANFELNAQNSGEDVKVSKIVISDVVAGGATVGQISNLRLYQGSTLLETSNSTSNGAASSTFTLKTPITITKGSATTLKLVANISNSANSNTHTFNVGAGDVTAVGATTGNSITGTSLAISGAGQAITLATTGSATASLVSGTSASPSSDQLINVGTSDAIYYAFKLTASNEALKMRTIKLTVTSTLSTKLDINAVRNIRLLANGSVVATANQMDSCSAGVCTITFSSTDNIFGATTVGTSASTAVTVAVKADIGAAGAARLGDNFRFLIASSTTDLVGVGASSGVASTITGTPTVTAVTYINPFSVAVSGVSPATPTTVGTSAGIGVGIFKVVNNGSAPISLTKAKFTDGGASTSSRVYHLYASADGGAQSDVSASTGGVATSTTANFTTSMSINGGSWRYLIVKMDNASANNDTYQLTANSSVSDFTFSVTESDLGYDANGNGTKADTATGLGVVGNPTVEMVTAKN